MATYLSADVFVTCTTETQPESVLKVLAAEPAMFPSDDFEFKGTSATALPSHAATIANGMMTAHISCTISVLFSARGFTSHSSASLAPGTLQCVGRYGFGLAGEALFSITPGRRKPNLGFPDRVVQRYQKPVFACQDRVYSGVGTAGWGSQEFPYCVPLSLAQQLYRTCKERLPSS
jgi:hypothetical protein